MKKLKTLLLSSALVSVSGLAYAQDHSQTGPEKIQSLIEAINDIQSRLDNSNIGTIGAVGYAAIGGVIMDDAMANGIITPEMLDQYLQARDAVLQHDYAIASTAEQLFMQEHAAAMNNLMNAVDDLTSATGVLMVATGVAMEASEADTKPEQVALQSMLQQDEYSIQAEEVEAYNQAVVAVENYAQQAGAFMAAANNTELTASIDNYATQGNFMVGSYTALTYTQSIDEFVITWEDSGFGTGWQGYLQWDMKTAEEVYSAGEYIQEYGGYPTEAQ